MVINGLVSLITVWLFREYGWDILLLLFSFKVTMLGITFYLVNAYRRATFFYYYNLGISKRFLFGWVAGVDLLICILLFVTNCYSL